MQLLNEKPLFYEGKRNCFGGDLNPQAFFKFINPNHAIMQDAPNYNHLRKRRQAFPRNVSCFTYLIALNMCDVCFTTYVLVKHVSAFGICVSSALEKLLVSQEIPQILF